ncbi:MAG: hypothetical protein ABI346_00210 [Candidatus Baltobacteraceae bacterium]
MRVGVGATLAATGLGNVVVSCGLAGGLRAGIETGTLLIPRTLGMPDGTSRACDEELVGALVAAALAYGSTPLEAPLLCSSTLVRGAERARWAAAGYAGVDMESARLQAPRLAAVRVVLDTPERELSNAWLHPATAFFKPAAWRELPWLARTAPACARLAAEIVARAFPIAT